MCLLRYSHGKITLANGSFSLRKLRTVAHDDFALLGFLYRAGFSRSPRRQREGAVVIERRIATRAVQFAATRSRRPPLRDAGSALPRALR
jgi:hypothetical protein